MPESIRVKPNLAAHAQKAMVSAQYKGRGNKQIIIFDSSHPDYENAQKHYGEKSVDFITLAQWAVDQWNRNGQGNWEFKLEKVQ